MRVGALSRDRPDLYWGLLAVASLLGCGRSRQGAHSASGAGPNTSSVSIPAASGSSEAPLPARPVAAPCPTPTPSAGYPPWHRGYSKALCVRDTRGRWRSEQDPTDVDGWKHWLVFDGVDGASFRVEVIAPLALALRVDGSAMVVDLKDHLSLISAGGELRWRRPFPRCGHTQQLAIGQDNVSYFTCGYSILRFDADGALDWQKWPFGNHRMGGPWVDQRGTVYVSGDGSVAALDATGEARWKLSLGFNRAVGDLMWNAAGQLVCDTSMAELHTDSATSGGYRFYHEPEPNALFVVSATGRLLSSTPYPSQAPSGGWPEVLPRPEDGAHRVTLP